MFTNQNLKKVLMQSIAEILRQGVELLTKIDDGLYTKVEHGLYRDGGAIGGHFRHCLEFVNCFLGGIETKHIDYDRRERNHQIETDREFAITEFMKTIRILENLSFSESGELLVKPEDFGRDEDYWCRSSIERELEFLQSHTIHHYALIGFKLRSFGFELPKEFGVAPSTLRYWSEQKKRAAK